MAGPLKLKENDVERQINDFLRWRHWIPLRLHAGVLRSMDMERYISLNKKGTPDWCAVHPALGAIFYETKAPGKKPTKAQIQALEELRFGGFRADWFDGLEPFEKWYKGIWPDASAHHATTPPQSATDVATVA